MPFSERASSEATSNPVAMLPRCEEFAERYSISLRLLKKVKNLHDAELPSAAQLSIIGPDSPVEWRQSVEQLGKYFQREFGFDQPPYEACEADAYGEKYWNDRVLTFSRSAVDTDFDEAIYFVGAVGIRRGPDESGD